MCDFFSPKRRQKYQDPNAHELIKKTTL